MKARRRVATNRRSRIGAICRKLASTYRRMGALHQELARTIEGEEQETELEVSGRTGQAQERPQGADLEFDERARAAARRILRQVGFKEVKR
jgi:hypothetical protein